MATLYDVSIPAISQHLKRIFGDNELTREATIKKYLIVQTEGEREVRREVDHYNLQAILLPGERNGVRHFNWGLIFKLLILMALSLLLW